MMKNCPQCHSVYTEDYVFCLNDGTMLESGHGEVETVVNPRFGALLTENEPATTCHSCGLENRANSRFCKKCGLEIRSEPVLPPVADIFVPLATEPAVNPNPVPAETTAFQMPTTSPASAQPFPAADSSGSRGPLIIIGALVVVLLGLGGYLLLGGRDGSANPGNEGPATANNPRGRSESPAKLAEKFEKTYVGNIGGQDFTLELKREGDKLSGSASTRKTDSIYGTIDNDGNFELKGYENDTTFTGLYKGRVSAEGTVDGTWTTPGGTKPRSFYATER